jgi:hypothetical protein
LEGKRLIQLAYGAVWLGESEARSAPDLSELVDGRDTEVAKREQNRQMVEARKFVKLDQGENARRSHRKVY